MIVSNTEIISLLMMLIYHLCQVLVEKRKAL